MASIDIKYNASPTLSRFLDSSAFVRAIVGPLGSGKSSGCNMEFLIRAVQQKQGPTKKRLTRFAAIRNTYRELRDTTRKTFEQWIPHQLGQWHEADFAFRMKFNDVESEVLFRALDRPQDVKKLLSLELTGAYINEAREVPKHILDVLQGRVGRYPSMAQGGPTWFGVWMDTNPWHVGHWGYKLFSLQRPQGFELFEQPGGREPNAENLENLPPGYYERLVHGKDKEWVEEYVDSKYPKANKGSVYGELLANIQARGGMEAFEHPSDGIFASFDLGISDSTAIWWWRVCKRGVEFVDHYEAHGEAISHFFGVLDSRPYSLKRVYLPHDARARTLTTGLSVADQFLEHEVYGPIMEITPSLDTVDGIAALRWLLEQPETRFHPRCSAVNGESDIDGIEALREFRYEWDEDKQVYKKTPLHNWASHTADAGRYVACVVQEAGLIMRQPKKEPPKGPRSINSFSMDEVWKYAGPRGSGRV